MITVLFLTTVLSCKQAMRTVNNIHENGSIAKDIKTELIQTLQEAVPYCTLTKKE